MHLNIDEGFASTANATGTIAAFGGTFYAIATDTVWVGIVTFVATIFGVLINAYRTYHDVRNKSLESRLEARLEEHKREIIEVKAASAAAFQQSIETLTRSYDESLAAIRSDQADLARHITETLKHHQAETDELSGPHR